MRKSAVVLDVESEIGISYSGFWFQSFHYFDTNQYELSFSWGSLCDRQSCCRSSTKPFCGEPNLAIARYPCYYIIMIQSFKDKGTEDIFNGENTRIARKTCPKSLWRVATRKLDQLDSVSALHELSIPPGNRLEALSGERAGQHSIRINDQFRICFVWLDIGPDLVEICDYHS